MFYVFNNRHPCNYGEERDRRKLKEIQYIVYTHMSDHRETIYP